MPDPCAVFPWCPHSCMPCTEPLVLVVLTHENTALSQIPSSWQENASLSFENGGGATRRGAWKYKYLSRKHQPGTEEVPCLGKDGKEKEEDVSRSPSNTEAVPEAAITAPGWSLLAHPRHGAVLPALLFLPAEGSRGWLGPGAALTR